MGETCQSRSPDLTLAVPARRTDAFPVDQLFPVGAQRLAYLAVILEARRAASGSRRRALLRGHGRRRSSQKPSRLPRRQAKNLLSASAPCRPWVIPLRAA